MGKIAFLFAGQGAQSVGMGVDLYRYSARAKAVFDAAGEAVKSLCFKGPHEALNLTANAQPCLFAMDLASAAALNEFGVYAAGVAGFSLGEIPALAYSGILPFPDALALVRLRGRAMQKCAEENPGAMIAVVNLPPQEVEAICKDLPNAYPVNYNAPTQTVVACKEETVRDLTARVASLRGKAMRLAVSGAFHCPFMGEAARELEGFLASQTFGRMELPLYANATGGLYQDPAALIARQVTHPVLWQRTIEQMILDGFDRFIEVGPGKVLSGLVRKINADVSVLNAGDVASLQNTIWEVTGVKG